jgi:hypothetical protein
MFMVKEGVFGNVESGRLWAGLGRGTQVKGDSYREKEFPTFPTHSHDLDH